jgi:hypothetical protein
VLFACSGIAIERQGYLTRFVTSASLARAFSDANHDNIKVGATSHPLLICLPKMIMIIVLFSCLIILD